MQSERKQFKNGERCPESGDYWCSFHYRNYHSAFKEGEIFPTCHAWGHNDGTYQQPVYTTTWLNWNPEIEELALEDAEYKKRWGK